jgi:hypothetical protein
LSIDTQRAGWGRTLQEFLVIVVGVLTALGVESVASSVRDRGQETEYLNALAAELTADTTLLARLINETESTKPAAVWLLALIRDRDLDLEDDRSVVMTLVRTSGDRRVPLNNATYLDLLNTGNLRLIRDMAFRAEIVRYYKTSEVLPAALDRRFDRTAEVRAQAIEAIPIDVFRGLYSDRSPTVANEEEVLRAVRENPHAERALEAFLRDTAISTGLLETHKKLATELLSTLNRLR